MTIPNQGHDTIPLFPTMGQSVGGRIATHLHTEHRPQRILQPWSRVANELIKRTDQCLIGQHT